MKNLSTMSLIVVLTACVTTHQVRLPDHGYAIDLNIGDSFSIVLHDGRKHSFQVTHIDELAEPGDGSGPLCLYASDDPSRRCL